MKLKQQDENLKKKFKLMTSYQRESPLNYFSDNLIFEECLTKKLGLLLDEYLDSKQFKIVNKALPIEDEEKKEKKRADINNMTLKELVELVKAGKDEEVADASNAVVIDLDV